MCLETVQKHKLRLSKYTGKPTLLALCASFQLVSSCFLQQRPQSTLDQEEPAHPSGIWLHQHQQDQHIGQNQTLEVP